MHAVVSQLGRGGRPCVSLRSVENHLVGALVRSLVGVLLSMDTEKNYKVLRYEQHVIPLLGCLFSFFLSCHDEKGATARWHEGRSENRRETAKRDRKRQTP